MTLDMPTLRYLYQVGYPLRLIKMDIQAFGLLPMLHFYLDLCRSSTLRYDLSGAIQYNLSYEFIMFYLTARQELGFSIKEASFHAVCEWDL